MGVTTLGRLVTLWGLCISGCSTTTSKEDMQALVNGYVPRNALEV